MNDGQFKITRIQLAIEKVRGEIDLPSGRGKLGYFDTLKATKDKIKEHKVGRCQGSCRI